MLRSLEQHLTKSIQPTNKKTNAKEHVPNNNSSFISQANLLDKLIKPQNNNQS